MRLDLVFIDGPWSELIGGCKSKTCTVNVHACLKFECIKEGNSGDKGAEINTRMVEKVVRNVFTEAFPAILRSFMVNTWVSSVFMFSCVGTYSPRAVY